MDALKIKYQNQICYMIAQTNHFDDFLKQLEIKLTSNFFLKSDCLQAFFSFPFSLQSEQYRALYTLCDQYHLLVLGFLNVKQDIEKKMCLYERCFYAGNTYNLTQDVVYVGDIEKDVYITSSANFYVIGNVYGTIDLLHSNQELSAYAFVDAKIRIFDSKFQNMTNNAPCKVYYEDGKIKQA
ncbi:MAG: hypothetical protein EOM50_09155 [Erysipelotrichia bacterium]|nr:hypothetical protein [Erysipelotrichia bacterium]NCC54662.1 hypothetical protein [Erysipelotrichia bacterium]